MRTMIPRIITYMMQFIAVCTAFKLLTPMADPWKNIVASLFVVITINHPKE